MYHHDVNKQPRATEKFKEISAAYEMSILMLKSAVVLMNVILKTWSYKYFSLQCRNNPYGNNPYGLEF
nr:hypothetical protein CFP56_08202 [Quercus suber]